MGTPEYGAAVIFVIALIKIYYRFLRFFSIAAREKA